MVRWRALCLLFALPACSVDNGGEVQVFPDGGVLAPDGGAPCRPGEILCADQCVDPARDPEHCGQCNLACGVEERCTPEGCAATPVMPPPEVCDEPIGPADVSSPDHVIGDGTPGSCDEGALAAAVAAGGVIVFDCGPDPVVIPLTSTLEPPLDRDTTIDGGHRVTLDGQDQVRILYLNSPDFRATETQLTLQRLTLRNGHAPRGDFTPQGGDPRCAWGYKDGAGGAVYVRDARLRVYDVTFVANDAASPGPDVGGGAIYALGSLDVTVVASRFVDNAGSNAGAVGLLQSTGTFVNTTFENNAATGEGQNYVAEGCPPFNHDEQGGAGGNGGALAVDGIEPTELFFCGVRFVGNRATELGGAVFRTPNADRQATTFVRTEAQGNRAGTGGGGFYISNSALTVDSCLFTDNRVTEGSGGALRTELNTEAEIVNTTFASNAVERGLGGALWHASAGRLRNCTFADNAIEGGATFFSAAIGGGTSLTISNTIFSNNVSGDQYNPMQCWFEPATGQANLQWPRIRVGDEGIEDTECTRGIAFEDPRLAPLDDHGGPTRTMRPGDDSPARGRGVDCPPTDQRGEPRPAQGCTAGALE